jgi:hypothetical protein
MTQHEDMTANYLHLVLTSPTPGAEDEFNEWYDNVHVPQVLQMPGFLTGRRFQLVSPDPADSPSYLAVYEIESDDIQATLRMIPEMAPSRTKSTAIDTSVSVVRMYEAISPLQRTADPE